MWGKMFASLQMQMRFWLLVVKTLAAFMEGNGESLPFRCTSPCQYASPDSDIVRCTIESSCYSGTHLDDVEDDHLAPSAPRDLMINSFNQTEQDGRVYLTISPEWRAPSERIELLTGFQVKTMCNKSPCVSQQRCVTVTFNRTLTTSDVLSKFSMNCQFWNFSQPSMEYLTIVRSLPESRNGANNVQGLRTLPSCEEAPEVSVCRIESRENWKPQFLPSLDFISSGLMKVTILPALIQGNYPNYSITLIRYDPSSGVPYFDSVQTELLHVVQLPTPSKIPSVSFGNILAGGYIAQVQIADCPNCPVFQSANKTLSSKDVEAVAASRSQRTTPEYTGKPYVKVSGMSTPSIDKSSSVKNNPDSLSLAALAGALGGCLGIGLLFLFGYLTCTRKWQIISRQKSEKKGEYVDDQYVDDDSFQDMGIGTKHIYPHSNTHSCLMGIDNPSMIPQTVHNDLDKPNGILLHESNNYANIIGYGKGDSISTFAVDVHSSQNGWVPAKLIPASEPKFISSPLTIDSGVELASSESTEGDDETLVLSLALVKENLGELV